MPVITSYSTLVQAIRDEAEDDGAEFLSFIPTAIDLAEERMFREFDIEDLQQKATGNLSSGINTLAKPTGYRFPIYFYIKVSSVFVQLKKKTDTFIRDYWPNSSTADVPKYYTDDSATNLMVAPTPASAYEYEFKYSMQPTKLSAANETNYFTTHLKDALFNCCMAEMSRFSKSWSEMDRFEAVYSELRDGYNLQAKRKRMDSNSEVSNMGNSAPNTLSHSVKTDA